MSYTLLQFPQAERQLRRLRKTHSPLTEKIVAAIRSLADNPRPVGARRLMGRAEMRIRVGDYRVLYLIDDVNRTVNILAVAHRREVYK